jgi:hypothetical protein
MAADKFVSIKQGVMEALEFMGRDDMRSAPMLNDWAVRAEKKIGSYYGLSKEICIIDMITDCKAKLPCGTQEVLGVLVGDHGTDCDIIFEQICNLNVNSIDYQSLDTGIGLTIIGGDKEVEKNNRYEVRGDNTIEFPYSITSDKLTVKVLKHPEDQNGFIKVQSGHLDAIAAYIKWKVAEMSRFGPNKMTMSDVNYYGTEWGLACRNAIAESSWPSDSEKEEISGILNNPLISNVYYKSDTLY